MLQIFFSPPQEESEFLMSPASTSASSSCKRRKYSNASELHGEFTSFLGDLKKICGTDKESTENLSENEAFMKMIARKLDILPVAVQHTLQSEILTLVNGKLNIYFK